MIVGQSWKMPEVGRLEQSFEPPPQFGIPDEPTSDAPIMTMTVPVTMGGKIRLRVFAGANESRISRNEQISEVPGGC